MAAGPAPLSHGGDVSDRRAIFRFGLNVLVVGGILLVVFLTLDALGIAGDPFIYTLPRLMVIYLIASSFTPLIALLYAGLLVNLALNSPLSRGRRRKAFYTALAAWLVLGVGAVILRHGILVKTTSRAPEDHFPIIGVFLALFIGIIMLQTHKKKNRWSGAAFLLIAPTLIILAFGLGLRFDPHAITEARAIQIRQAIESYHQDTGAYPAELEDLSPNYLPLLLGPLTGRGQTWCYQSGTDYYQLGRPAASRNLGLRYRAGAYETVWRAGEHLCLDRLCSAERSGRLD